MRQRFLVACVGLSLCSVGCTAGSDGHGGFLPLSPSGPIAAPAPAPAPAPPPVSFPSIKVGEVVRFQFTTNDLLCDPQGGGRCRSYEITAPSTGVMDVVVTSISGDASFVSTLEMYVVPGADDWMTGPGPRISASLGVVAGATYEIRMYSSLVPSAELELRATLQ